MNTRKKRKPNMDDGMSREMLYAGTEQPQYDGKFQIPFVRTANPSFRPKHIVPFSRRRAVLASDDPALYAIGFCEMDPVFTEVLRNPEQFIGEFRQFGALITPDCSLYLNMPIAAQITNVYRNRVIGFYYQQHGCNVIPQVRWGCRATYTKDAFGEAVAFRGVAKHSIVAIGTYGCLGGETKDEREANKCHMRDGLGEMLKELEPKVVLVYGSMPKAIFRGFAGCTEFILHRDWTKLVRGGDR